MTNLRLRCRHRNTFGLAVKGSLQRACLDAIIEQGGRAVKVYVVDVLRFATCIFERQTHRACGFVAILCEANTVISIASGAVTDDLRIDACASSDRVFKFLK